MTSAAQDGRPLRVGLCIKHYPPEFGGHGLLVERTLPHLAELGVEVEIAAMRLPGPAAGEPAPGVLRILPRGDGLVDTLRRGLRLGRHLRSRGRAYDLFHSVMPGPDFLINLPLLRRLGLPVLWEMNLLGSNDPVSLSRTRFGRRKIARLKTLDAWAGVSRGFLPSVRAVGFPVEKFHPIHGAVDVETFRPACPLRRARLRERLELPVDARIAVSVGSVIPRKGMDRVVAAWREMRPVAGRDLLLIVGPDSTEERLTADEARHADALRSAAAESELRGTVRLTGRVENVADYVRAADVFVFLSRAEGMGLVIPEAMAAGLPCVVSPLDGIAAEMVTEGESGHIVPAPDDPAAVATTLERLLSDPELRRRQGEYGRRVALERFSLQARAAATAALYRKLAGGDPEPPGGDR